MKHKFQRRIVVTDNGKKSVMRTLNPRHFTTIVLLAIAISVIVLFVISYLDDFSFSFAISCIAVLVAAYSNIAGILSKSDDRKDALCLIVEKVNLQENKIILGVKNCGTSDIIEASICDITINNAAILKNADVNYISVNSKLNISHISDIVWLSLNILSYRVCIPFEKNAVLVIAVEQAMEFVDNEYTIIDNTCRLSKQRYYRWWI